MVSAADLDRLHRLIVENPEDLNTRLIYADSLQESGDPRGEFIALQINGDPRADTLLRKHQKEWTSFLRPAVTRGFRFINGFVERITLNAKHLGRLPGIMKQTPLHQIRFRDLETNGGRLAKMTSCTERITWLDLKQGRVSGTSFGHMLSTGSWPSLWRIWAPSNHIGLAGLLGLIHAELPHLQSLNMHGTVLSDKNIADTEFAGWKQLKKMTELNLRGNPIGDTNLAAICRAAKQLKWIGLPTLGPETAEILLKRVDKIDSVIATDIDHENKVVFDLMVALGSRFELVQDYTSAFDLPWP